MSHFLPTDYTAPGGGGQTQQLGAMHQPTQYIFPLLKAAEIEQCMSELGIELTKQEMMEPQRHKEKVRKVFYSCLDVCCGTGEENFTQAATDGIAMKTNKSNNDHEAGGDKKEESTTTELTLPYPDLHNGETMTDVVFFRELRKCMTTCGIYDFSWRDIHNPMSKRFRCQLSAFINMAKFREEQLRVYSELMEPRYQLLATLEEVNNEHETLLEQHAQVQEESAAKMVEMDNVIAECQQLETEIARCNKLQASKREEAAALKKEVNNLKDEVASATWAYQETQAEEEQLQGQVVSSPDRRRNELESKKTKLSNDKEDIRTMQEEIQLNKKKHHNIQQAMKTLEETASVQQQVLEEATKYENVQGQLAETRKDIETTTSKTVEIENQMEEANRTVTRIEDKLVHMRKQSKLKMDAVLDRINTAKQQLLEVEMERQESAARVDAGEAEVRQLQSLLEEERRKTDHEISELIAEYKDVEKAFLERNEKRMEYVDSVLQQQNDEGGTAY